LLSFVEFLAERIRRVRFSGRRIKGRESAERKNHIMIKKSSSRVILAALCLALCASTVRAGQENFLQSEEGFVAQMNGRAVFVAPGVYEVTLTSGERIRVGFGENARRYDQARLQKDLRAAKASPQTAAQKRKIRVLTHALRGLADQESDAQKTAETGATCNFAFTLDGGHTPQLVGGETWGNASIGLDVDFGPSPPSYPGRTAYTYVATKAFPDQGEAVWAESVDTFWNEPGTAYASAEVNCGSAVWDCYSWEVFSYVREYGCTGGYRSIHRTN
jgi:hypothetical protein